MRTKNDLRLEFYSLGGSPVEFNPKWTKAELLERVEQLQEEKFRRDLKELAKTRSVADHMPKRPPTVLDRVFARAIQVFFIGFGLLMVFAVLSWFGDQLGGGFFTGLVFLAALGMVIIALKES